MTTSQRITIGDVCSFLNGGTPSKSVERYFQGDIPWITGADITSPVVTKARSYITKDAIACSATNRVPAGTVLLVTRTSVGKVAIAGVDLCFSQDITALIPDTARLHARYLVGFLKTQAAHLERQARGATIKGITRQVVADLEIPLPPLAEQRRIAAVLDQAEALRAKRRAALAELDSLTQSIFLDLFGDPATNPKAWPRKQLSEVVAEFRYGTSNKSQSNGTPALRIPNVAGGVIDLEDLKLVPVEKPEFERLRLHDGDLLFVRTNGNPEYVGRCAVFETATVSFYGYRGDEFIYASYLIRARLSSNKIMPVFLREFLMGPEGRRQLRARSKTSAGQFNINIEGLGGILIPIPPLPLQREFARRVTAVERLKTVHRASLAELDALFATLQHRAFRGEL